ncbi:MAG: PQQ-binding-like beta-propeller repeat protein [Planctomycetes bacterium]|nr:PQQ-binding-like beta-propeller repeat protein [Planctomycetota bacterium]
MPRFASLFIFTCCASSFAFADNWPAWRGPEGSGHSRETDLPVKWDNKNVVWKTELPGEGQSSPAIFGDRIYLTAALQKGRKRVVLCVDRLKGAILWQHEAWAGKPEPSHPMNGWASATCATDGARVYAFFGKGGLHCYTADGKKLWSRDLGSFAGSWGTTASPLLVGNLLVQNCDSTKDCFLLAVDKVTGKDVWRTPRKNTPRGGWSSPVLIDTGARKEIVLNGESEVIGYEPETGKILWTCKSFIGRGEPTVAPGKGQVYVVNGLAGDIYSVKTGGSGDVTKTHMAWHTPRKGGRDQPSPILVGNYLVTADMTGIATCYDASTGKVLWRERLRTGFTYTASPIAASGKVYFLDQSGATAVLEPGPAFKLVTLNELGVNGEMFRASPSASGGQIFLRSQTHLYCIGKSTP